MFFALPVEEVPQNAALQHAAGTYVGLWGSSQMLLVDCIKIALLELERDKRLAVNVEDQHPESRSRRRTLLPTRRIDGGDVLHCPYFKDLFERSQSPVRDRAENDFRRCLGQGDDLMSEAPEFEMPDGEFTRDLMLAIAEMWTDHKFQWEDQREHNTADWINLLTEEEDIAEVDLVDGQTYHASEAGTEDE